MPDRDLGKERRPHSEPVPTRAHKAASNPYVRVLLSAGGTAVTALVGWLVLDAIQSRDELRDINTAKIDLTSTSVSQIQQAVVEIQASVHTVTTEVIRVRDSQNRIWPAISTLRTRISVIEAISQRAD
jgi:hypothetical protein